MRTKQTLTVAGDFRNLEQVARFVRRIAAASGLSESQTDDVEMAVDEAVSNVIEHSYAGHPKGKIAITCIVSSEELVVEIRDQGKPFDPGSIRDPLVQGPISERSVGGLGVFFTRKLMDWVEFESLGARGNLVIMGKRIPR